jgi:hypothetical protein
MELPFSDEDEILPLLLRALRDPDALVQAEAAKAWRDSRNRKRCAPCWSSCVIQPRRRAARLPIRWPS